MGREEQRWVREDNGEWRVYCEIEHKMFGPRCKAFDINGRCPECGANAKNELEVRKREKEKYKKNFEKEKNKNTLESWI